MGGEGISFHCAYTFSSFSFSLSYSHHNPGNKIKIFYCTFSSSRPEGLLNEYTCLHACPYNPLTLSYRAVLNFIIVEIEVYTTWHTLTWSCYRNLRLLRIFVLSINRMERILSRNTAIKQFICHSLDVIFFSPQFCLHAKTRNLL